MRAAYIEETGPVENIRVGDLPDPTPGPGEVEIAINGPIHGRGVLVLTLAIVLL